MAWRDAVGWCALVLALAGARGEGGGGAGLLAVPSGGSQSRAREMIHGIYAKDYLKTGAADRRALAKLLLAQGRETQDDAAARYVVLVDAADIAAGTGDAGTAFSAIDALASVYTVNHLDLRYMALFKAQAAATQAADCQEVMRLALVTADEAVAVDAFDIVRQLATVAEEAANKTRQVKVVASIQEKLAELRGLIEEFGGVKAAFAALERDANDAQAHLVIGRFYALHKGQWAIGLPHLAVSDDAELRDLAARELARPADGLAQAALGDAWWEYAEKSTGLTRAVVRAHATDWYKIAQKTIQGITLARIESRIQSAGGGTGGPGDAGKGVTVAAAAGAGAVDLLALLDPAKDAAVGKWTRGEGGQGLVCESSAYACLALPYSVPEEYDLRVKFTRLAGEGQVAVLLVGHGRPFELALDVKGEARFERVDGKVAKDNPTTAPVAISNNRPYTVTVEVRKEKVRALLDGKPLTEWKTDYKDLSRYAVWKLGKSQCGVGANNAKVVFMGIELVEVTGKGKETR